MKNSTKLTLWKIYFWIVLANGIFTYFWQSSARLWDIVDLIITVIAFTGLYAFVWKKVILSKLFWKIYFFVQVIWNIFYFYFLPLPEKLVESLELSQFDISTTSIVFYIPLFFALYSYGYKADENIKK